MSKWYLLIIFVAAWITAGMLFFDTNGRDHTSDNTPDHLGRIVTLAPNITEIAFELGLGENVVGVSQHSTYPEQAADKPTVGSFWQPNTEAIIALKPQLVITAGFGQQRHTAQRFESSGIECLSIDIESLQQVYQAIEKIGKATNTQTKAKHLSDSLMAKLDSVDRKVAGAKRIKTLCVVQREPSVMVAGQKTFINEMIQIAGGINAIGDTVAQYPAIGSEHVILLDPEVIIEFSMITEDDESGQQTAKDYWGKFSNISAVKTGQIYIVDADLIARPGPRFYQGVEAIAKCLHPEQFQ